MEIEIRWGFMSTNLPIKEFIAVCSCILQDTKYGLTADRVGANALHLEKRVAVGAWLLDRTVASARAPGVVPFLF